MIDRLRLRALALPFTHLKLLDGARRVVLAGSMAIGICAVTLLPKIGWLGATQLLLALCILRLLARYVEDRPFPLPFHDGTLVAAAGSWGVVVTVINAIGSATLGTQMIILTSFLLIALGGLRMRVYYEPYWFE